jgi:hypothetical protein
VPGTPRRPRAPTGISRARSCGRRSAAGSRSASPRRPLTCATGLVRLVVDPAKAPNVVKDFEGVTLLAGGSGEIDKKGSEAKGLTHLTDAIGYYVAEQFPVADRATVIDY